MTKSLLSSRLDKNGIWIPAAKISWKLEKVCAFLELTSTSGLAVVIIRKRNELVSGNYAVYSPGIVV
jgi:hypothetical protein